MLSDLKADGEEHIVPVHAALPGHHVHGGVGPGMSHMEALAGGIGELHQGVEFLLVRVTGAAGEGLLLPPLVLPFLFDGGKIVLQNPSHFLVVLSAQSGDTSYNP